MHYIHTQTSMQHGANARNINISACSRCWRKFPHTRLKEELRIEEKSAAIYAVSIHRLHAPAHTLWTPITEDFVSGCDLDRKEDRPKTFSESARVCVKQSRRSVGGNYRLPMSTPIQQVIDGLSRCIHHEEKEVPTSAAESLLSEFVEPGSYSNERLSRRVLNEKSARSSRARRRPHTGKPEKKLGSPGVVERLLLEGQLHENRRLETLEREQALLKLVATSPKASERTNSILRNSMKSYSDSLFRFLGGENDLLVVDRDVLLRLSSIDSEIEQNVLSKILLGLAGDTCTSSEFCTLLSRSMSELPSANWDILRKESNNRRQTRLHQEAHMRFKEIHPFRPAVSGKATHSHHRRDPRNVDHDAIHKRHEDRHPSPATREQLPTVPTAKTISKEALNRLLSPIHNVRPQSAPRSSDQLVMSSLSSRDHTSSPRQRASAKPPGRSPATPVSPQVTIPHQHKVAHRSHASKDHCYAEEFMNRRRAKGSPQSPIELQTAARAVSRREHSPSPYASHVQSGHSTGKGYADLHQDRTHCLPAKQIVYPESDTEPDASPSEPAERDEVDDVPLSPLAHEAQVRDVSPLAPALVEGSIMELVDDESVPPALSNIEKLL